MTYDVATLSAARLWSYHPDWSAGYEITRAFRTDITASRNQSEQRRALRDVARVSARYRTVLQDDDLRAARHFLRARQNDPAAAPDFSRYALLTGASSSGGGTLTLADPPAWVAADRLLVLCSGTTSELVEVASVADPTITIAGTLDNNWASGAIVRPALHGLLDGNLQSSRYRRSAAEMSVAIDVYPGGEPVEDEGAASDTFNGYEVFTAEPEWSRKPSLNYLWPVEQIDYGIGRAAQFRPVNVAQQLDEAEFAGLTAATALAIEQVFLRAKGRRGAFYRPSGEKDFVLAATASSGASTFLASGSDLVDDFGAVDYGGNPAAIEVCKTDGTRLRRLITGITPSGGNSSVAVNSAWPSDLTTSNVARISWMPLVRFASDEMTTLWRTPSSATIRASFQSVKA